jgi:hypothetical protein
MLAVTACERNAGRKFRDYLKKHGEAILDGKRAVRVHQCRKTNKATLGEAVYVPGSDVHHILDSEVMLAVSHSIEDLAMDIGKGELIATFQDLSNFEPQRQRYVALAEKLDAVRVWGAGEIPQGCRGIDFIVTNDPKVRKYWLVLFESPTCRAILLCRQVNQSTEFARKRFVGFYSFNPYLVQSIRWRFNLLTSGLSRILRHWEKTFPFPDCKAKEVEAHFRNHCR